jgi:guanylate kinase
MTSGKEPIVFIVSGPSASGKSTLVKKLLQLPRMLFSISCTTRPRRAQEDHTPQGEWYNFVSPEEFRRMVEAGEFLEHACVFGKHWYGTPRLWLDEARARRLDLVLEIDVQGASQVKAKLKEAVAIFILPPSSQALAARIRDRGQDSEEEIKRRLERARQEIEHYRDYDYLVVNDDIERAGQQVQAIARAVRGDAAADAAARACRRDSNAARVRGILDSFGGN